MKHSITRILVVTLAFSLCGLPEALAQAAKPLPDAPSTMRLLAQNQQPAAPQTQAAPAQDDSQQPAPTPEQPRVVPVAPQAAPGTDAEAQDATASQDTAAVPQEEGTTPKVIPPPSPEELQQLQSAQQQNQPAEAPVNNRVNPVGTAAAESARTAGGGASRPAGVAIAPAKQKRSRSFLIKMGAVLAAGAALGTIYGLSRSTNTQSAK